jgi:hypothetical protein
MHQLFGMGVLNMKKQSLEKLQYKSDRIITGATRSVTKDCLVKEVGWVSLSDRRKIQKLTVYYRIIYILCFRQLYQKLLSFAK